MQPLRDYLNNTQQYKGILNPDQNQVMTQMTDDMIRQRIREYCTYDLQKYFCSELWDAADPNLEIVKIDKDEQGWYVDTKSFFFIKIMENKSVKSYYNYCAVNGYKMDKQKGFLIEDIGVYFRWRRHKGTLKIFDCPNLEYTDGLPEELECLHLHKCCQKSGHFIVRNKIKLMVLSNIRDTKISGNGCKNVIIYPASKTGNITAPSQTKILRPKTKEEYLDLRKKLCS